MTGNGNYVTRAELTAHLEPMKDDIAEIKDDVKGLVAEAGNTWLGKRGRTLWDAVATSVVVALAAGAVSAGVALFFN